MFDTIYHNDNYLSQYTFLVTGGAGFIGSNLVEYLLKYKAGKVRVLDNFKTGSKKNIVSFLNNPAFEIIEGDIRDFETCKKVIEGVDYLSHQAALGSVPRSISDPITSNQVNINGFLNIMVAAKDAQVKRMVYASSSSVYGDHPDLPKTEDKTGNPLSPYAVTKYVNELYAAVFSKTYSFHTIGLRYFNVFGPKQNTEGPYAAVIPLFIEAALNKQPALINGDGTTSRDFTFIENIVQANVKAMFSNIGNSEVINIAFGERISLNKLWNDICEITNSYLEPVYGEERKGDVKHSLANVSKASKVIGYQPSFSVLDGLKLSVEWYRHTINIT